MAHDIYDSKQQNLLSYMKSKLSELNPSATLLQLIQEVDGGRSGTHYSPLTYDDTTTLDGMLENVRNSKMKGIYAYYSIPTTSKPNKTKKKRCTIM